jgi:hypothetical protein
MDFIVEFEHSPEFCPHSNTVARKQFEATRNLSMAKKLGIEVVFAGIAVPEHKTFMVLRASDFKSVRSLFVKSGIVQTNDVRIRILESFEEFAEEIKSSTPMF